MSDTIQLFNLKLARDIVAMNNDELWEFMVSRIEQARQIGDFYKLETWLFICLESGMDLFKTRYWEEVDFEPDRINLDYTLILDFAFEKPEITLDYYGIGGFYDNPASCHAPDSADVMPEYDEESNELFHKRKFFLLDAPYLDRIIKALEENLENLTVNTPADIETIKVWREKVATDEDYRVAYIYDEWR